jgi:ribonuclease HI
MKEACNIRDRSKSAPEFVLMIIHIDGGGMRPDGTGSGYAYFNETSGKQGVRRRDGLTNNQSEYRALAYALLNAKRGSAVEILSDSQLIVNQFNGKYAVRDPDLKHQLARVRAIIRERDLQVTVKWVPRSQNLAGKLLERGNRGDY